MRKRKGLIILLILVLLGGIFVIFGRRIMIEAIVPDLDEVTVTELVFEDDTARIKLTLSVYNRGVWRMDLLNTRLNVYDDTTLLLEYSNDSIKTIERGEFKTEVLYLTLPLSKIMASIREHQGEDSIALSIKGEVTFESFFGERTQPVNVVYYVRIPVPPRLHVRQIDYLGRKEKRVHELLMHMTIVNLNPRSLDMKDVSWTLSGEDLISMNGFMGDIKVAAMDSTVLQVPVNLKLVNRAGLISRIILDKDMVDYSFVLRGTIEELTDVVDNREVPVTVHSYGRVELYNPDRENGPKINIKKKRK
jgi:hypothetical protein